MLFPPSRFELKFRFPMFHFTELEKMFLLLLLLFLKSDLIPKLHLLKPKALLSTIVVAVVIVAKVKVMYSGLKMLETIITEAFFSIWIYIYEC